MYVYTVYNWYGKKREKVGNLLEFKLILSFRKGGNSSNFQRWEMLHRTWQHTGCAPLKEEI